MAALTPLKSKLRSRTCSAEEGFNQDFTTGGLEIDSSMEESRAGTTLDQLWRILDSSECESCPPESETADFVPGRRISRSHSRPDDLGHDRPARLPNGSIHPDYSATGLTARQLRQNQLRSGAPSGSLFEDFFLIICVIEVASAPLLALRERSSPKGSAALVIR